MWRYKTNKEITNIEEDHRFFKISRDEWPSIFAIMSIFNVIMASVFYLRHENPLFYIIVDGIFGAAAGFFPRAKTSTDEDDDDDDAEEEEDADKEEDSENDRDESAD